MDNLKYRGFKGKTTIFPEFRDRFGVADIDLMVLDPDFIQGVFKLFTLQVFFFGVNDQFSHTLPSCIILIRYRIIVRRQQSPYQSGWQDLVSFTSDMLRKKGAGFNIYWPDNRSSMVLYAGFNNYK